MHNNKQKNQHVELTLVLEIPSAIIDIHQQQIEKQLYNNNKTKHSNDILSDSYVDHNILD